MTAIEFTTTYYCRMYTRDSVSDADAEVLVNASIASGAWREQCRKQQSDNFADKTVSNERISLLECKCFAYAPMLDRSSISVSGCGSYEIGYIDYIVERNMLFFTYADYDLAVVLAIAAASRDDVVDMMPAESQKPQLPEVEKPVKNPAAALVAHKQINVYGDVSAGKKRRVSV